MAQQEELTLDFTNQALIQDEILLAICLVLEQGWPAGPTFLHALNTLIEAVVIHDAVYFDVHRQFRGNGTTPSSVHGVLRNSQLVNLLVQENALRVFPETSAVENYFVDQGRDYSFGQFFADLHWSQDSFFYSDPADEATRLDIYVDVVSNAPLLLQPQQLVPRSVKLNEDGGTVKLPEPQELLAMSLAAQLSLSEPDLLLFGGPEFQGESLFRPSAKCWATPSSFLSLPSTPDRCYPAE
jgi:hypothetical protein